MLFDLVHNLYMIISSLILVLVLVLLNKFIKNEEVKTKIFNYSTILTVLIHISTMWVEFLQFGKVEVDQTILFTIHPCNVIMWLLVLCAVIKNKKSKFFTIIAEFCFYAGLVCGIVGIALNENYANNPNLLDWSIFKGLISHSTMIFSSLYLLVGGFIKIRVSNVFSCICGLATFIVIGFLINTLYAVCGLPPCNSMYLLEPPFPEYPFISSFSMGILALIGLTIFTMLYEQIKFKKEDRWYSKLKEIKK